MQFTRKKNKQKIQLIILLSLVFAVAALIVTAILLDKAAEKAAEDPPAEEVPVRDGEGRYLSYATAYPPLKEEDMMSIEVENEEGHYVIARPNGSGRFNFVYFDEQGKEHSYYPDILLEEENLVYDDLYAKVTGDGYDRIPVFTYLTSALRNPYFDARIDLDSDAEKRAEQLETYGFYTGKEGSEVKTKKSITLSYGEAYTDADGNKAWPRHTIEIGSKTVTGSGYYYRVDGRDYIYVTNEYNYFNYALIGIEEFINPVLVTAGLDNNKHALYAPYLTPSYRQWLNEVHGAGDPFPTDKNELKSISSIVADVDVYLPSYTVENKTTVTDSYEWLESDTFSFDVLEYKDNPLYEYFLSALSGRVASDGGFSQSFLSDKLVRGEANYVYKILAIEGIITEKGDATEGTVGADARYVKVKYDVYANGSEKQQNVVYNTVTQADGTTKVEEVCVPYHGILDLEYLEAKGIDTSSIRGATVGNFTTPLEITIEYKTPSSGATEAQKLGYAESRYYVDEILAIYEYVYDASGKVTGTKTVTELKSNSLVLYRYHYTYDGVAQTAQTGLVNMTAADDESQTEQKNQIRAAIRLIKAAKDKKQTLNSVGAYTEPVFTEPISDFLTYKFENVRSYVTSELVIGFGFVNASERDPFYGESFYEKHDDVSLLYAVNHGSCEKVVKHLGGIAETSEATGLVGNATVDVGITHEKLVDYGCYANMLEFKLPRDMYVSKETAEDELDDMSFMSTLDFVLYISDPETDIKTGKMIRYVASTLYDIIVTIDAEELGFVDLDPVEYWARRSLILLNVENIKTLNVEFNMSDLKGDYRFDCEHNEIWINQTTGEAYFDEDAIPESAVVTPYDWIDVKLTQNGEAYIAPDGKTAVPTEFENYLKAKNLWNLDKSGYLSDLYDYLAGKPVSTARDTMGTSMFKNLVLLMFYTQYTGILTEEEQQAALDGNGDGVKDEPLMSFSLTLTDKNANADTAKEYCYEFYRCDDRRVMVRIYEKKGGEVVGGEYASDFYLSILGYRKIVSAFVSLLNGKEVNAETPYPDFMN